MKHILMIEDDSTILYGVSELLREEGLAVSGVESLKEALAADLKEFDLVILDLGLPDGEGWEFLEKIFPTKSLPGEEPAGGSVRKNMEERDIPPVIILTAREDEADIIRGLDMGADDYVTKPFKAGVLCSRIRAVLRRRKADASPDPKQMLVCGDIRLDKNRTEVFAGEKLLNLTAGEFRLLQYLMENRNRTITRNALLSYFWDSEGEYVNDNTLSVTVKRLREKLGGDLRQMIRTVRGIGYKMEDFND